MRTCFFRKLDDPCGLAQIDLTPFNQYDGGLYLTRVLVPRAHRGKGIGGELLRECLSEADKEGVKLWLDPVSYKAGGLSDEELSAWYGRHGFVLVYRGKGTMCREPRKL